MSIILKLFVFLLIVCCAFPSAAQEDSEGFLGINWDRVREDIGKTATDPDHYDLYIPVYTWHNRWTYDRYKIDRYNERPRGIGFGVSRFDRNRNEDSLYFTVFKDSNYNYQTAFGYTWQRIWRDETEDWRFGAGVTLTAMQRKEYNYIPIPMPLPVVSVGFKRLDFQATYIPGTRNNGNVLFTWVRLRF